MYPIIDCVSEPLLPADVSFSRLHALVAQEVPDLLDFSARVMAQAAAFVESIVSEPENRVTSAVGALYGRMHSSRGFYRFHRLVSLKSKVGCFGTLFSVNGKHTRGI